MIWEPEMAKHQPETCRRRTFLDQTDGLSIQNSIRGLAPGFGTKYFGSMGASNCLLGAPTACRLAIVRHTPSASCTSVMTCDFPTGNGTAMAKPILSVAVER